MTLTDTTARAVMEEDGSVYCQPDTLFQGACVVAAAAPLGLTLLNNQV